jgi:hypothetical protein
MTALSLTPPAVPGRTALTGPDVAFSFAAAALLLLPGVLAFGPVFGGADGYIAAGGGALIGLVVAFVAHRRRWAVATTAATLVGAYLLLGGALALRQTTVFGVLPTPDTLLRLVPLSVQSWRDLLTVRPPAASFVGPAVVPYLSGILAGLFTGRLALSVRRYLWALLPSFGFLIVGILWGIDVPAAGGVLGLGFAVVALLWAVWRRHRATALTGEELLSDGSAISGPRTVAAAAALVAAATALAVAVMPLLGAGGGRVVLRQFVQPPLNLQDYASPLTGYRYLVEDQKEATLFTVAGLPRSGRQGGAGDPGRLRRPRLQRRPGVRPVPADRADGVRHRRRHPPDPRRQRRPVRGGVAARRRRRPRRPVQRDPRRRPGGGPVLQRLRRHPAHHGGGGLRRPLRRRPGRPAIHRRRCRRAGLVCAHG